LAAQAISLEPRNRIFAAWQERRQVAEKNRHMRAAIDYAESPSPIRAVV
jgi:hypothetical protein